MCVQLRMRAAFFCRVWKWATLVLRIGENEIHQSPIPPVLFICTEEVGVASYRSKKVRIWQMGEAILRGGQFTTYVAANSDIEVSLNIVLCQFLPNRHGSRYQRAQWL